MFPFARLEASSRLCVAPQPARQHRPGPIACNRPIPCPTQSAPPIGFWEARSSPITFAILTKDPIKENSFQVAPSPHANFQDFRCLTGSGNPNSPGNGLGGIPSQTVILQAGVARPLLRWGERAWAGSGRSCGGGGARTHGRWPALPPPLHQARRLVLRQCSRALIRRSALGKLRCAHTPVRQLSDCVATAGGIPNYVQASEWVSGAALRQLVASRITFKPASG